MKAPHPSLRRLFAVGTVPARAFGRLTAAGDLLAPLQRAPEDERWFPLMDALEPLLRDIDLSEMDRKASAAMARRNERAAARPRPEARHARRFGVEPDADAARRDRPVSPELSVGMPAELSAGGSDPAPRRSPPERHRATAPRTQTTATIDAHATARSRSGGDAPPNRDPAEPRRPVSRADAIASLRRRAARAGDAGIGDTRVSVPAAEFAEVLEHIATVMESRAGGGAGLDPAAGTAAPRRPVSRSDASEALHRRAERAGDAAIADLNVSHAPPDAGLAELLEHLATRTEPPTSPAAPASKNRRNGMVRLERTLASLAASQPSAFGSFGGGRSRRARRTLPTASDHGPEANGAAFEPAAGGLRGLAARVSRSRPEDFDALRPAARPSDEDLAGRLDALLKDEARRLGIDLEEIER